MREKKKRIIVDHNKRIIWIHSILSFMLRVQFFILELVKTIMREQGCLSMYCFNAFNALCNIMCLQKKKEANIFLSYFQTVSMDQTKSNFRGTHSIQSIWFNHKCSKKKRLEMLKFFKLINIHFKQ